MKITDKKLRIKLKVLICIVCAMICAAAIVLFVEYDNGTIRYVSPAESKSGKYLFVYFVGNGENEEQIHFSVSEDGYNYKALNGGKSVIKQELGKLGVRDPYIIRCGDGKYRIIATDMKAEEGWTSNHALEIWTSSDLINWTDETNVDIRSFKGFEKCNRAWAPQAIYDRSVGKYMVYFAISTEEHDNPELYYCYTTDFKTFTAPKILYDRGEVACIDGDIVYNSRNGLYYLYFKYENSENAQKIAYVTSKKPTGPYNDEPIIVSYKNGVEGSSMYNISGTNEWVMAMDCYYDGEYTAIQTNNFEIYSKLKKGSYNFGKGVRHGSFIKISDKEYNALVDAFGIEE